MTPKTGELYSLGVNAYLDDNYIHLHGRWRINEVNPLWRGSLIAAAVMGCAVAGMHYTAMGAALFFPISDGPKLLTGLVPMPLAAIITIFTVLIASITLVASFAGRQAGLALSLKAEIAERKRGEEELIQARRADARLVSAVARLQAGIALFDENDKLVMANPTYRQIHEIIAKGNYG